MWLDIDKTMFQSEKLWAIDYRVAGKGRIIQSCDSPTYTDMWREIMALDQVIHSVCVCLYMTQFDLSVFFSSPFLDSSHAIPSGNTRRAAHCSTPQASHWTTPSWLPLHLHLCGMVWNGEVSAAETLKLLCWSSSYLAAHLNSQQSEVRQWSVYRGKVKLTLWNLGRANRRS